MVAAHVSKVSKDYSPYGYSIMESSTVRLVSGTGGRDVPSGSSNVLVASDAEVFIEEVRIVAVDEVAADAVNYVVIELLSYTDGLGAPVGHTSGWDTRPANQGAIEEDGIYSIPVTTPVVTSAPARALSVAVSRSANDASVNSKAFDIYVRYRRKA